MLPYLRATWGSRVVDAEPTAVRATALKHTMNKKTQTTEPADVASDAGGVISGLEREITEFRDIHHIHTLQVQGGLRL